MLLAGPRHAVDAWSPTRPATTSSATGSALLDRSVSMAEMLDRRGLVLRSDLLRPWAHWITPEFEPKRFDTRFFVAAVPTGQRPRDVSGEADDTVWLPVAEAVAGTSRPTGDAAAHDRGAARDLGLRVGRRRARGTPRGPAGAAAAGRATATALVAAAGGRRDGAARGWAAAGPGRQPRPDDPRGHQHLRAARRRRATSRASWSTPGRWTRRTSPPWSPPPTGTWGSVLLTHGHPDHSDGARAAAGDDRRSDGGGRPAVLRRRRAAAGRRAVRRGRPGSTYGCWRRPGHTADSVSFVVAGDEPGLLTGDTILGRGTTVVAHPDGRLPTTSSSLAAIRDLPGPLDPAARPRAGAAATRGERAAAYLAHRAQRLDQVRAALAAGDTTPQQVVRRVYADVDERSGRPPSSRSGPSSTTWPRPRVPLTAPCKIVRDVAGPDTPVVTAVEP